MHHKAFWCCAVALLCVSQTKAGGNTEVRVAYNPETERDGAGNQQKTHVHDIGRTNAEDSERKWPFETVQVKKNFTHVRLGPESSGKDVKLFEMSMNNENSGTRSRDQEIQGNMFNIDGTKQDTISGRHNNIDFKSHSDASTQIGRGNLYSTSGGSSGKTGTLDISMQDGGSMQIPSRGHDDPKPQIAINSETSGTTGTYAFDGSIRRTPGSTQLSSIGIEHTPQVTLSGVVNQNPDVLKYNSGSTVQNAKADFPSYTTGVSVTANSGGSIQGQPNKPITFNTANIEGNGYVLPSGSSIPQNSAAVQQGSQTPTGTIQTTRINAGIPVTANTGGSVYTPTYTPGGTISISGGGFGGSYGQTSGGYTPGYNIGMQQGFRIPTIGIRPVSGQISGGILSGRSQSGVMFPVGTQQMKVGYGTSGATRQMGYIPQVQLRSVQQMPRIERISLPVTRVNPVYTSFASSVRVPSNPTYFSVPTTGVSMTYGQNQVRSSSVPLGTQLRIPSTNIQYMSGAGVPAGVVQVSG